MDTTRNIYKKVWSYLRTHDGSLEIKVSMGLQPFFFFFTSSFKVSTKRHRSDRTCRENKCALNFSDKFCQLCTDLWAGSWFSYVIIYVKKRWERRCATGKMGKEWKGRWRWRRGKKALLGRGQSATEKSFRRLNEGGGGGGGGSRKHEDHLSFLPSSTQKEISNIFVRKKYEKV